MEPGSGRERREGEGPEADQSNLYAVDPPDGPGARAEDVTPDAGTQAPAGQRPWWDRGPPPAERVAATAEELAAARAALERAERETKAAKKEVAKAAAPARAPWYSGMSAPKASAAAPDSEEPREAHARGAQPGEEARAPAHSAAHDAGESAPPGAEGNRRDFFKKAAAVVVGGAVVGVPVAAGVNLLLDPLSRGSGAAAAFIPVAPLDAVPADGSPMQFPVKSDRTDAWNQFRNVPIGAVFLKRVGEAVKAFNVVCPHAGCFVQTKPDGSFLCPCHNSGFHPDGSLAPNSVSPRGLDELEVKLDGPPGQQVVTVKFQNFHPATSKKHPV